MIYDYKVKDAQGNEISIKDYKGKVLLVVNTATGCGFTPQYEGLQKLYDKYKDKIEGIAISMPGSLQINFLNKHQEVMKKS